jgi:hypothetical protein
VSAAAAVEAQRVEFQIFCVQARLAPAAFAALGGLWPCWLFAPLAASAGLMSPARVSVQLVRQLTSRGELESLSGIAYRLSPRLSEIFKPARVEALLHRVRISQIYFNAGTKRGQLPKANIFEQL